MCCLGFYIFYWTTQMLGMDLPVRFSKLSFCLWSPSSCLFQEFLFPYCRRCVDSSCHMCSMLSLNMPLLCWLVPGSVIFSVVKTYIMMILMLISFPKSFSFIPASGKHFSISSSWVRMGCRVRLCKSHCQCCKHDSCCWTSISPARRMSSQRKGQRDTCLDS